MQYLAYDTETNGLPLNPGSTNFYDTTNWPRVYQVGALLFDDMGFELGRVNEIIRPDGWKIPETDSFLSDLGAGDFHKEHGITTEYLMDVGKPVNVVMKQFIELANESTENVAHNASFDFPVMTCEFFRLKHFPQFWAQKKRHCTKLLSEPILKIPGYKGKYKWPTLTEAYMFFFGKPFEGAHDAFSDVQATMEVFLAILAHNENNRLSDNDDWLK